MNLNRGLPVNFKVNSAIKYVRSEKNYLETSYVNLYRYKNDDDILINFA